MTRTSRAIGEIEFDSPFVLAPLAGVSDSPFRQLAREQGASAVYTEMVSADGLARNNQATLDYCRFEPHERPVGIQLFGADPGVMAEATRILCDLPEAARPDLIDINMGCPVRKVVNRCAGAALLNDLPRLSSIVARMAEVSRVPVTAKIRLGWDGNSQNVVEVSKTLEQSGAKAVAIHARTRAEKFEGAAHWEMIAAAKQAVGIPVIGNGDVRTPEDGERMLETTGCDLVMLGRAAFGDPWVFRRVRARHERGEILPLPTAAERLEAGIRHLELLVADVGELVAAKEMRKHVAWYVRGLPHSHKVREQVNQTRNAEDLAALLTVYLETLEQEGLAAFAGETAPDLGSLRAAG
ncbi:MAG TPA: tRNA dihydrouridine synthase DusB [Candidatus Eisenbacteria bacterium]|nr:tRNA dihydrouridine synthase DusB [Candidatus Eisenbacteria bacterium]